MPEWLLNAVATGGPAAALIMTYMWWRAEKRATRYEDLWVAANGALPEKILAFAEQQRVSSEKLAAAIAAVLHRLGESYRHIRGGEEG